MIGTIDKQARQKEQKTVLLDCKQEERQSIQKVFR